MILVIVEVAVNINAVTIQTKTMELTKEYIVSLLPKRPKKANKGTFGKVLVIAGSENYPGAAYLTCASAYRVGAGLVTLVTNTETKIIVSRKLPELTFISPYQAIEKLNNYDVILIGPGLGQSDKTQTFIKKLLKEKLPKAIFDGDGLNILSKIDKWWEKLNREVVLTPHLGEMSRLTGLSIQKIQKRRTQVAREFANKWGKVVVLKGANSVVVPPAGEARLSLFSNPLLATAGTGDILSGIIAGMIAQGLTSFDAASVGIYIHALAGQILREKIGDAGLLASDLLPILPGVIEQLKNN